MTLHAELDLFKDNMECKAIHNATKQNNEQLSKYRKSSEENIQFDQDDSTTTMLLLVLLSLLYKKTSSTGPLMSTITGPLEGDETFLPNL